MNKTFAVRVLRPGEIAALRAMLSMFGSAFDEIATYTQGQPDDAYLARLLASDTFVAIAACAGDAVVGGIAAYVRMATARAESQAANVQPDFSDYL